MGGGVSVTNRCGHVLRSVWVELSMVYPYHFDEVYAGDTHEFGCGKVWLSLKVTKVTPKSREIAEKRRRDGYWKIGTAGVAFAAALLEPDSLAELATELFEGGWSDIEFEPLVNIFGVTIEDGVMVGEFCEKELLTDVLGWVEDQKGLAGIHADLDSVTPLSIVLGEIHRGVYANGPKYHVEARRYIANGRTSPPIERVKPRKWESMCRMPQFKELIMLTLVRDE